MFAGQLALTIAALFTGAAIYINIAEQPARLQLDDRSLPRRVEAGLQAGLHKFKRASRSSAESSGSSPASAPSTGVWLLGVVVLLANWPYTIFVMMATNRRLMHTPAEAATAETRRMIRWDLCSGCCGVLLE
jgi:hypothetical protein